MKLIPLTQGQFAKVDDEDFDKFGLMRWHAQWDPDTKTFYACGKTRLPDGKYKFRSLHRLIMNVSDQKIKVDHINHDGLDDQKLNLRTCDNSQNLRNRGSLDSNNTSGYRGVSFYKPNGKWVGKIRVSGRLLHLGYFPDKIDAAEAYAEASKTYFGEFGGIKAYDDKN
jgi:hypothetical protein